MRSVSAADASRSPRYFGRMIPLDGSPTRWPAQTRQALRRHVDHQTGRLAVPGVADAPRSRSVGVEPAEEARDLLQRTLRRGEAHALKPAAGEPFQSLEGEREMSAALGGHD